MRRKSPTEAASTNGPSRRDRLAQRRKRRTRVTVALIGLLVVGGAAAAGAYVMNTSDAATPSTIHGDRSVATFGANGTVPGVAAANQTAPRHLDHAHPLRLWIGGDSLAGSFGPALGDKVGATGVVQTTVDYKVSSGLSSNDIRDWYGHATTEMNTLNPEAVVFIIGTNDWPIVNQADSNHDGVPDWEVSYRAKVDRMMDLLIGPNHRSVFWLGPPTLGTSDMNRAALAIGQLMQQEAAKRSPDVAYVDTYKLFATKNGDYSRNITDENGKTIEARIGDGVHFSEDGAQYLARAVYALIDTRWQLTKQADPSQPIGWTLASGSGETVPGFSSAPQSRYRTHSYTNQTYEPTTFPQSPTTFVSQPSTSIAITPSSTSPPTSAAPATTTPTPTTAHETTTSKP
jgi:hypothetical protein